MKKKFLIRLHEHMIRKSCLTPASKPAPAGFLVFAIALGFRLEVYPRPKYDDIVIRLYMSGKNAKTHFHALKEQQQEIEREFGEALEWDELRDAKYSKVSLSKSNVDLPNEKGWLSHYEWLATKLEKLNEVFRPRIEGLEADV